MKANVLWKKWRTATGDCSLGCLLLLHFFFSKNTYIFHSVIRLTSRKVILTIWEIRGVESSVCSIGLRCGVLLELWMELGEKCPWFSRLPQHLVVFESKIESCFKSCQNRHSSHPAGLSVAQSLFWMQQCNDEALQNFRLVCTHWMGFFFLVLMYDKIHYK